MKKVMVLLMAMAMCLAILAGCKSADPNNPYGQEPAPQNKTSSVTDVIEA